MYADDELSTAAAAALEAHLDSCADCRTRIASLKHERMLLRAVLAADEPIATPAFQRPLAMRDLLPGIAVLVVTGALASLIWGAIAAAVPSGLRWLSPLDPGSLWDLTVSLVLFLTREGSAMLTSIVQYAAAAVLVSLFAWACASLVKQRAGTAALLSVLLLVCALPQLGHALEVRRSEGVTTLAAGERVDDTLLAVGETVAIDGDVNGDLLAFGQRVTVRGNVSGDVISAGETVDVQGSVGGNVIGAGRAVTIAQRVGRNLYAAARDLTVSAGAEIGGNASTAGDSINVDGKIGMDLVTAARSLAVRGNVMRNVLAYAGEVTLLAPATVGGNLTARVGEANAVSIASGATVSGTVDTKVDERMARTEPGNKYLTVSFYVGQVVRLGMAFLVGLLLLWLFPGLQTLSLASGGAVLRAAGFGLITAVTLPVLVLIACITIVGIPLGVIGVVAWLLGLYFAKIIVAQFIGQTLFRSPHGTPHYAATLLAGLVIVLIAVNLPWIGWLAGLVLTLVGLGMLVAYVYERFDRKLA